MYEFTARAMDAHSLRTQKFFIYISCMTPRKKTNQRALIRMFQTTKEIWAGCDEAGRGCLAGPVFAAAVILPPGFKHAAIHDSKKLSHAQRLQAREVIKDNALAWAVQSIDAPTIDRINILNASILAMHHALDALKIIPKLIAVDGNRFKMYKEIPHHCIIKGDSHLAAIGAASILAKTYRDEYMEQLHEAHPQYNWKQNKSYGTLEHRIAIAKHGYTAYHRKSFVVSLPELT